MLLKIYFDLRKFSDVLIVLSEACRVMARQQPDELRRVGTKFHSSWE